MDQNKLNPSDSYGSKDALKPCYLVNNALDLDKPCASTIKPFLYSTIWIIFAAISYHPIHGRAISSFYIENWSPYNLVQKFSEIWDIFHKTVLWVKSRISKFAVCYPTTTTIIASIV